MSRGRRRWWITRWGAALLAVAALLLGAPGAFALLGTALLPAGDAAGVDVAASGPGILTRVVAGALGLAVLTVPPLTYRWARRRWAGYVLLGLGLGLVAGLVGLVIIGVL